MKRGWIVDMMYSVNDAIVDYWYHSQGMNSDMMYLVTDADAIVLLCFRMSNSRNLSGMLLASYM